MIRAVDLKGAYDVAVVGAGPAGLAAAAVAARAGLATVLFDENPTPGGQIYRAITTTPLTRRELLGPDYWHGTSLVTDLGGSGAEHVPGAIVWSLTREREIGVSVSGVARTIRARRVILATGALERPFPIPGWTLPGVMTAGATQTLLKTSGIVPEGRVVLAGSGPLLWLLGAQLLRAGVKLQAVLDTTPWAGQRRVPALAAQFVLSPYFIKGMRLMAEVAAKVRVIAGVTELAAEGAKRLESVMLSTRKRRGDRMPTDVLLLHQGVVPNVNLAMAAGVEHRWDEVQACWSPVVDGFGTTALDGIAVAGDGAGIAGARVAEARGRLAAIAAVRALKPGATPPDEAGVRAELQRQQRGRAFLDVIFQPAKAFRVPMRAETIVCRCEEVTAGQIREAVKLGAQGPNQAKSYLRSGMGPCQGRLCGLTVTELIADARGVSPSEVGYYRLRPPVKPITLAELAAIEKPEAAVNAVVRL